MHQFSTELLNHVAARCSWAQALTGCKMLVFGGPVPSNPEVAVDANASILCAVTDNGGVWTPETRAVGAFKIVTATSGTFQPRIGGSGATSSATGVPLIDTPLTAQGTGAATATALVAAINAQRNPLGIIAAVDGGDSARVLLYACGGAGADFNGLKVGNGGNQTGVTLTDFGAATPGVAGVSHANGLRFVADATTKNKIVKAGSNDWKGTNSAAGVATFFRAVFDSGDTGLTASTAYRRWQGKVGVSGAEWNMSGGTTFELGAPTVITSFGLTVPGLA